MIWGEAVTFRTLDKEKCCGCEACSNICPTDAIQMFPDDFGFMYPKTCFDRCIHCEQCIKRCPQLSKMRPQLDSCTVYGGYAKEQSIVENSSSGGCFTLIAEAFLKSYERSSVVSVVWASDYKSVYHTFGKMEQLEAMRRSKYVQSRKMYIFREIRDALNIGESILFVGCPCEVAGLVYFLGDTEYQNLFLIDLVCQGPTSPKVLEDYVEYIERKYSARISDINLRYNGGSKWIPQWLKIKFQDDKEYLRVFYETELGIAVHYMQRPACYSCQWNGKRRLSDMTLGDFHGVDENAECFNPKGTSVVVVNTVKGELILDLIKQDAVLHQVEYKEVASKNPRIEKSWAPLPGAEKYMENYKKYGLRKAAKMTLPLKKKIRFLLPNRISGIINHQVK